MFRKYLIFLSLKIGGEFYLIVGMSSHSNESWKSYLDLVSFPITEILIHFSNLNVIETQGLKKERNVVLQDLVVKDFVQ